MWGACVRVSSNPAETSLSGPGLGTGAGGVDPVRPDPIHGRNGREFTTGTGVHTLPRPM